MIDLSDLIQGEKYDLTMKNGHEHKAWYLYDKPCGYFTKDKNSRVQGLIYCESVSSVTKSLD